MDALLETAQQDYLNLCRLMNRLVVRLETMAEDKKDANQIRLDERKRTKSRAHKTIRHKLWLKEAPSQPKRSGLQVQTALY